VAKPDCIYHTFRGRRYRVCESSHVSGYGATADPMSKGKTIHVRRGQDGEDELDTLIHEGLHACYWDLEESAVGTAANDISRLLWKKGYRRLTPEQIKELGE
jgi:hypothetical protein